MNADIPRCGRCALITGATGYLGSNLVRHLLAQAWEIHIVVRHSSDLTALESVRKEITVHIHDNTTQSMVVLVKDAKPDIVFNLASLFLAQHKTEDIESLINSNLLFPTQLVEAMVLNGVRCLVNTGTSWQHYNNEIFNPVNLYASTKQAYEDILAYYIEAHGLNVATLSLFDTYGPDDPRGKLMSLLWKTALTQQALSMSPGEQLCDLVYVDDVVHAFSLVAESIDRQQEGHVRYGVSSGRPMRLIDLVALFERVTQTTLPITFGGRPYRPREVMVPWTNYLRVPGWQPKVALETGILRARPGQI
jgi:nucleoside-diphosphate-sugar epimerase